MYVILTYTSSNFLDPAVLRTPPSYGLQRPDSGCDLPAPVLTMGFSVYNLSGISASEAPLQIHGKPHIEVGIYGPHCGGQRLEWTVEPVGYRDH